MPAAIAVPLILGGVTAGTSIAAAKMQSGAASRAARQQSQSANYAADIGERSARAALEYQKQQAAEEARRYEIDRRANYDLANAHEQRLGTLSQMFGFGQRQGMPAYVPGLPATPGAPGSSTGGAVASTDPRVADVFNRVTQGLAPTAENLPKVIDALNAAGITATRATHAGNQLSDDFINFGGGGGLDVIQNVGSPNARWQMLAPQARGTGAPMGSLRDLAGAPTVRPALGVTPYVAPSTLRSFIRR